MPDDGPRFDFPPLERRGLLLGLQASQLAVLGGGALLAVIAHSALSSPVGLVVAAAALAAGALGALWRPGGRALAGWAAAAAGFAGRRVRAPLLSEAPSAGGRLALPLLGEAPLAGHRRRSLLSPGSPATAPPGVSLVEHGDLAEVPFAVVEDRRLATVAAVLPVGGRSFGLLDAAEQSQHLEAWRRVLGALARPGTPVARLQWVVRTWPADPPSGPSGTGRAERDYRQLLAESQGSSFRHDTWLVLAVGGPASGGQRRVQSLLREMRLLQGQLRSAGLDAGPPLGLPELSRLVCPDVHARPTRSASAWPMAIAEHWAAAVVDGWWHATFWISEWPRIAVGPDFLSPLLLGSARRAVSVVMSPVAAERAVREVRSARTADLADQRLRAKAGFLPSARRDREATGVARREAELAEGHSEFRFSGYVTVAAAGPDELCAACAEAEHAAQSSNVELRRLYGRQAEAYTWTLPLARGLRP
ncbi:MAG TPA: SCO6880 family protein [Acidimicrobiales bacterium]|nr:SCO6880 family protein [Acidimicrobiales bacterium]